MPKGFGGLRGASTPDGCVFQSAIVSDFLGRICGGSGLRFLFTTAALKRLVVALQETRLLPSSMSC
jgi:hypothetical protein